MVSRGLDDQFELHGLVLILGDVNNELFVATFDSQEWYADISPRCMQSRSHYQHRSWFPGVYTRSACNLNHISFQLDWRQKSGMLVCSVLERIVGCVQHVPCSTPTMT